MNHRFNSAPIWVRSALAFAAAVSTVLVVGAVEGLIWHYEAGMQVAATPPTVIARR